MKEKKGSLIAGAAAALAFLALDQLTKYLARTFLAENGSVVVIPGVFEFYYLENRGAAFGMLANRQAVFVAIALVMLGLTFWFYRKLPDDGHYAALRAVCVLVAAGAAGNMLDRLIFGHVIDFLYFSLIDFPVFNIADCYVCIGVGFAVILLFTVYKNDDLSFWRSQN